MTNKIHTLEHLNTKEIFLAENTIKTKALYLVVVLLIVLVVGLIPIIDVSLSVQSHGIIRPLSEKTEIKAFQTELVASIHMREGEYVHQGDTLLTLNQEILRNKQDFLKKELITIQSYVNDLGLLTEKKDGNLLSGLYLKQNLLFEEKIAELDNKIEKALKEKKRNTDLYESELISEKEYDDLLFNLNLLEKSKSVLESNQIAQWKAEFVTYTREKENLQKQLNDIENQYQFYIITSPVSGTIEEFSGIYAGSILQAGQTIAVISPESEKIAELYVSAKDIGYLHEGQMARIQVDAFNYNQWGSIEGQIINISGDFILANDIPVFPEFRTFSGHKELN